MPHADSEDALARWLTALHHRHIAPYRPQEFTRALRALSIRYVERRQELPDRSPLDSAGKRAAFAAFYAPLHFFTTSAILGALDAPRISGEIADLGCGTGVCGAAWAQHALETEAPAASADGRVLASIAGIDANGWALDEARWNWQQLGVSGRAQRGDLTTGLTPRTRAVVLGWALNELPRADREAFLSRLLAFGTTSGPVLVIEPLARGAAPWWDAAAASVLAAGGRADEWKIRMPLPQMLRELSQRAGFHRDALTARTLWLAPK